MTAAIKDCVKAWSQHFKPNECKKINLKVIKNSANFDTLLINNLLIKTLQFYAK